MVQNINEISHINNKNCNTCIKTNVCIFKNRKQFLKKCLPFNNFNETKKNILNFDKTSYIYYYNSKTLTYYLDKHFMLHNYKSKIPQKENINIFTKEILFCKFNIDTIEIPGYYLFCNYTHIFNIFTNYYEIFIKKKNNKLDKIIDKFIIDRDIKHKKIKDFNIEIKKINKNLTHIKSKIIDTGKKIKSISQDMSLDEQIKTNQINILKQHNSKLQNIINTKLESFKTKIMITSKEIDRINSEINKTNKEIDIFKQIIKDIISMDNQQNFIKLSYKFNIFNISLLCENYFDIIKLLFSDHIIIEDIISIFKDFSLVNIYYLVNYYKKNLSIKNINQDFMSNKVCNDDIINNSANMNNSAIYNNIIHNEKQMKNITDININDIYRILHIQLIYIQEVLNNIEQYIPNYKKLFLMAIISYRNNIDLINNTWGLLNKKYIMDYIKNNISYIINNKDQQNNINYYYKKNELILYEGTHITYNTQPYGNCMENMIFQFLKVLFWNKEIKSYDKTIIKNLIRQELYSYIIDFFNNINDEKNITFINNWLIFITELPFDCINNKYNFIVNYDNYDFIKPDYNAEINPTINNLIIALKYLMNDDIIMNNRITNNNSITNIDHIMNDYNKFLTNIITKINENYTCKIFEKINIKYNKQSTVIELNFNLQIYTFELVDIEHAFFSISNNNNILSNFSLNYKQNTLFNYLKYSDITFSNLNAYIIYLYFIKYKDIYYNYILKINETEKSLIIQQFIDTVKYIYTNTFFYNIIINCQKVLKKSDITYILDMIIIKITENTDGKKLINIGELANNTIIMKLLSESNIYNILIILNPKKLNDQTSEDFNDESSEDFNDESSKDFNDELSEDLNDELSEDFNEESREDLNKESNEELNKELIKINRLFISNIIFNNLYLTFSIDMWIKILNIPTETQYYFLSKLLNTFIIQNWGLYEWLCLKQLYINNIIKEEYKEILYNILNTLEIEYTEKDWDNLFLDILKSSKILDVIINILITSNVYKQWENNDTWNHFVAVLNTNMKYLSLLQPIIPVMLTKDIDWQLYSNFWQSIINFYDINIYKNLIIEHKIYTKWSSYIYNLLIFKHKTLIIDILQNNKPNELSNAIWLIIFIFNTDSTITDIIINNGVCKSWNINIWRQIIEKNLFNKFIDNIIESKIYNEWDLDMWKLINSNNLFNTIIDNLSNYEIINSFNLISNILILNLNFNFYTFTIDDWKLLFTNFSNTDSDEFILYSYINNNKIFNIWSVNMQSVNIWLIFLNNFKLILYKYSNNEIYNKIIKNGIEIYDNIIIDFNNNNCKLIVDNYILFNCIPYNNNIISQWSIYIWIKFIKLYLPTDINHNYKTIYMDEFMYDNKLDGLMLMDYNKDIYDYLINKFKTKILQNKLTDIEWCILVENDCINYFEDMINSNEKYKMCKK